MSQPQLIKTSTMSVEERALHRLKKDLQICKSMDLKDISVTTCKNPFKWKGCMSGPIGSIWQNAKLQFEIFIPSDYPWSPPKFRFMHKDICHPNISTLTGRVCLEALTDMWSPVITIAKLLTTIQTLLAEPYIHNSYIINRNADALFCDYNSIYRQRVKQFIVNVKKRKREE